MSNLNEYAFKSVTAVSVGLVLSCFGKAGADYSATAIDQLCFVSGDQLELRFMELLVGFLVLKFSKFIVSQNEDELQAELTK